MWVLLEKDEVSEVWELRTDYSLARVESFYASIFCRWETVLGDRLLERERVKVTLEAAKKQAEASLQYALNKVQASIPKPETCPYGHPVSNEPGECLPGSCGWR